MTLETPFLIWTLAKVVIIGAMAAHAMYLLRNLFGDWKDLGQCTEQYLEAVMGYFTQMEIFSERRLINEVRKTRIDHAVMMTVMRTQKQQMPDQEAMSMFENEEVSLDTDTLIKAKQACKEALHKAFKRLSIVGLYVFIAIFISGI